MVFILVNVVPKSYICNVNGNNNGVLKETLLKNTCLISFNIKNGTKKRIS